MYFHKDWKPTWPSIRLNFGLHTNGFSLHHLWCLLSWTEHFPHRFHDYSVLNMVVLDFFLHIDGFPCIFVPCWTTWLSIGPNIHPLYIKTIGVAPLYRALRDCSNWYNEINVPQSKEIKLHRLTPVVRTCCRYQAYNWNEEQLVLSNEKWQKSISKPALLLGLKHWPL